ncbi:MAG: sulfotransferase [Pseudomonadales bacterium]|nr:sulfotransferase [Pseudomonadales bacterium]NRA14848.1 sulfotransferase [Oceanospirillaceae bacterium]
MQLLSILRKQAEYQQYADLKITCLDFWEDNPEPAILPLLALAYSHLGERQLAIQCLEHACSCQGQYNPAAKVDLAAVLIQMQRLSDAQSQLQQALQQQPNLPLGIARLGHCELLQGNLVSGQKLLEHALQLGPKYFPVRLLLIQLHIQQTDCALAQQCIDKALAQLQQSTEELSQVVLEHYQQQLDNQQLLTWLLATEYSQIEQWLEQQKSQQQSLVFEHWLLLYGRLLAERDLHPQAVDILNRYYRQQPDNISLLLPLAELLQLQGFFLQAIQLMRKALPQHVDNIDLLVQLGSACLQRFDGQARECAERALLLAKALTNDPLHVTARGHLQVARAANLLALVESQQQNFPLAQRMFRQIISERPDFIPALQGLGQQLMQQGELAEAVSLFKRIVKIDPLKGHSSLINARHFPEQEQTLEKMALAANQPSLEGPIRAGILFQLAAAWEQRQQFQKAFEFAIAANNASKRFLPYNASEHRQQMARIRCSFCAELYRHRANSGVDSQLPIFVVGMPRSGTTLVEQILAGHSQIFGAGELSLIPQLLQGLNRWERHSGSGRSYPDCIDDLTAEVSQGIATHYLTQLAELAPQAQHIVDKLPHNFENIGLIKYLLPEAKIISVRRDPRDIAISNYFTDYQAKHSGMGFAYDLQDIGEQLTDHNMLMQHWQQLFPGEILEINYEQIVDDLEASARKMLSYVGLQWQPQVLKFNELQRSVKTASVWQVRQPLYSSSKGKWRRYQQFLKPLIKATNSAIRPKPINMLTLPEPGLLNAGVSAYQSDELAGAELSLKKLLHHIPEHGAANYMLGLVYLSRGLINQGAEKIELALKIVPWHREWRDNLCRAYQLLNKPDKARQIQNSSQKSSADDQSADTDSERQFSHSVATSADNLRR